MTDFTGESLVVITALHHHLLRFEDGGDSIGTVRNDKGHYGVHIVEGVIAGGGAVCSAIDIQKGVGAGRGDLPHACRPDP